MIENSIQKPTTKVEKEVGVGQIHKHKKEEGEKEEAMLVAQVARKRPFTFHIKIKASKE